MTAPDREKALQLALAQIEKNHGKGSVMRLGDDTRPPIGVIPTGSIALDVALGVGGADREMGDQQEHRDLRSRAGARPVTSLPVIRWSPSASSPAGSG